MRIDLHCHTKKCKKGDPKTRNVDANTFVQKVSDAGVGIVAITNHNHFDRRQFDEFSDEAADSFLLWPGIELDVNNPTTGNKWHMLVVVNPADIDLFCQHVSTLIGSTSPDDFQCDFRKAISAFDGMEAVFISHCNDKTPFIHWDDMDDLNSFLPNESKWKLFYEPKTLATVGIWSAHGMQMMVGSDVQDWGKYEKLDFPQLRLPVSSFEQFVLLAQRDGRVIEGLLAEHGVESWTVSPHKGIEIDLPLFKEVNIIFGQKGTGKTEMLLSLKNALERNARKVSYYSGSDRNNEFDELLKASSEDRLHTAQLWATKEREIQYVRDWQETLPTQMSGYVNWARTRPNKGNKARFKFVEGTFLKEEEDKHRDILKTADAVDVFLETAGDLRPYLDEEDRSQLTRLLSMLKYRVSKAGLDSYIESESSRLANEGLRILKREVRERASIEPKPGTTGFRDFASGYMHLLRDIQSLKRECSPREERRDVPLGFLDDKGPLTIATLWRFYDSRKSRAREFERAIKDIRQWMKALDSVVESIKRFDSSKPCMDFDAVCRSTDITDLTKLVGVRKEVYRTETGEEYTPSSGEKGILLLGKRLNAEADAYLLDEPEVGMSNSFINAVVLPKIQSIGLRGIMVVVVTHNANIAVRTLPYCTVYREHTRGDLYYTYIGNPFINKLMECKGAGDPKSWSTCSMETLEGGPEAFYGRQTIYEAGDINVNN